MPDTKTRRFTLAITNAAEDIPRLITTYGRCCDGECALVLRPSEAGGVLVHITKDGARFWRAGESGGDAPAAPVNACTPKDAVALVKTTKRAVPRTGPITLRGQWKGWLHCEGGIPRVELQRKLATYGLLVIISTPEGAWRWRVERTEAWFSKAGADEGQSSKLAEAIERGLATAMGLMGEACSFRDSRRRAAFDAGYAEVHPVKPAREKRDPVERFEVREPKVAREKKTEKVKAAPSVTSTASAGPPPKRTRKTAAETTPKPAREKKGKKAETTPDAEKDKLLMAAFADAVKLAMAEA